VTFRAQNTLKAPVKPDEFALQALNPPIRLRLNEAQIIDDEKQRFKDVVTAAIANGLYSRFLAIHMDMSHRMHTMNGDAVGTQRFLPWHRDYLLKLETAMRAFDPAFIIPYWDWTTDRQVPGWLANFLPAGVKDPAGHAIQITRDPGNSSDAEARALPTVADVAALATVGTYTEFTLRLEGAQPFGLHNQVHDWVNGTMSDVMVSPADPLFWLHHAQIDRLWLQWAMAHPGQVPVVKPVHETLDPWPEKIGDVLDVAQLGYNYG